LLEQAAREHGVDLKSSYMVGDRWRDVEAGRAAGCHTIFVEYGYNEKKPENPDFLCHSLKEAVAWIENKEAKA
jgi:D-glycero-D-manno-heptose 1,7-bisphosphate phosphatase